MGYDIQEKLKAFTRISRDEVDKIYWSKRSPLSKGKSVGWYQSITVNGVRTSEDPRAVERTDHVLDFIPLIVGPEDSVLDVGSKEGVFTLTAAQICRKATGVDVVAHHVDKARFVQEAWAKEGKHVEHATFDVCNVVDHLELLDEHNVIFLLKVIYLIGKLPGAMEKLLKRALAANVKCILVQGHVTQTPFGDITSITRLFERNGYQGKVLRNVAEYPILLFVPRGSSFLQSVPASRLTPRRIEFRDGSTAHPLPAGVDTTRFVLDEYRNAFEDYLVNSAIPSGKVGQLELVPIEPSELESSPFGEALGVQPKERDALRVRLGVEFFDALELYGEEAFCAKHARSTALYQMLMDRVLERAARERRLVTVVGQPWAKRIVDKKVRELVTMYRRMKRVHGLVPSSKAKEIQYTHWSPTDFPYVIDYHGYLKRRDGANRRMILHHLGHEEVESMVVHVKDLDPARAFAGAHAYLRDGFAQFKSEIEKRRALETDAANP